MDPKVADSLVHLSQRLAERCENVIFWGMRVRPVRLDTVVSRRTVWSGTPRQTETVDDRTEAQFRGEILGRVQSLST